MRASASDPRVRLAAGIAALALLAGCSSGSDDPETEAAVSLAPAPGAAGPKGASANASTDPDPPISDDDPDDAVPTGVTTVVENDADIDVEDQSGDGSTVDVEEVRAGAAPGFVVVYDAGRTVLGSQFVAAGIREAVTVTLSTAVQSSQHLEAALFRDSDGDQQFDPAADELVVEREPEPDDADDPDEAQEPAEEPIAEDFDYYVLR